MIAVLSPAKSLDYESPLPPLDSRQPRVDAEAHQLAADWKIVLFLFGERNAELIRRHQTLLNQQFA